ncbi:ribose 5-phosphate isomerase B [Parapedobacter deserti]|uniref:Ribose 5-phosphate isomerase B n=1 Tax=Parapedobacter deserti TaxID=1912957 RepID=A0ABV7JNK8_9SPHI
MTAKKAIAIGGDHAGFEYKAALVRFLEDEGYAVKDFGTYTNDSADYPDFAHPVAEAVERGEFERGVLVCGSANGVAITANKHQGIRAAICWQEALAVLSRQHNDANIVCIPARFIDVELAKAVVGKFLTTDFEGGRHANRVEKIACH